MTWYDTARAVIRTIDAMLPADAPIAQRRAYLRASYPFGERKYWPYKAWLKAQREYLAKFGDRR